MIDWQARASSALTCATRTKRQGVKIGDRVRGAFLARVRGSSRDSANGGPPVVLESASFGVQSEMVEAESVIAFAQSPVFVAESTVDTAQSDIDAPKSDDDAAESADDAAESAGAATFRGNDRALTLADAAFCDIHLAKSAVDVPKSVIDAPKGGGTERRRQSREGVRQYFNAVARSKYRVGRLHLPAVCAIHVGRRSLPTLRDWLCLWCVLTLGHAND